MKKHSSVFAASLLAMMAMPALAQQQVTAAPESIVLETKVGSVMTSTGGEYQTAPTGKPLVTGESMMLTEGAKATVVYYYDNGKRKCVEHYAGPNTYVIDDTCTRAAWMTHGSPGKSALIIVGAGLIGAAILASMDDVPPGPISVSAGAR